MECRLTVEGHGDRYGFKTVSLSCVGGTITVKPHKLLQDFWGKQTFQGVKLTNDSACQPRKGCLLSLGCGTNATFNRPIITGYRPAPEDVTDLPLISVLCIGRGSSVTLRQGTFSSSQLTPLAIYDNNTVVDLEQCIFKGIRATDAGAAMFVRDATVRVRSSTFANNAAESEADGGAIAARDGARVSIMASKFYNNTGYWGGALHFDNQSQLEILPGEA